MKPTIALASAYGVVDERGAEIARLQEELALRDHRIDCLTQALDEAVAGHLDAAERAELWASRAMQAHTAAWRWHQRAKKLARQQAWKRRRPQ